MIRILIILFLTPLTPLAMASAPAKLETFRWYQRLLVIPAPTPTAIESELQKHRAGLDERDLVIIRLDPDAQAPIDREIAEKFRITAESREILLIGKDGRTTVRWPVGKFTIETIFARIDAMPMRQREMRERG